MAIYNGCSYAHGCFYSHSFLVYPIKDPIDFLRDRTEPEKAFSCYSYMFVHFKGIVLFNLQL